MKNSIDVYVEFSFKGETHASAATIDLDYFMEQGESLPAMHRVLAEKNGIDTYSYLYEVMEQSDIRFHNPQGKAVDFLYEGFFDKAGYEEWWRDNRIVVLLQQIARRELGIDDLERHHELKNALVKAYRLGKQAEDP